MRSPTEFTSTGQEARKYHGHTVWMPFWLSPPSLLSVQSPSWVQAGFSGQCKGFQAFIWRRELGWEYALGVITLTVSILCALSRHISSPQDPPMKPRCRLGIGHKDSRQLQSISRDWQAKEHPHAVQAFKMSSSGTEGQLQFLTLLSPPTWKGLLLSLHLSWEWLQWADIGIFLRS